MERRNRPPSGQLPRSSSRKLSPPRDHSSAAPSSSSAASPSASASAPVAAGTGYDPPVAGPSSSSSRVVSGTKRKRGGSPPQPQPPSASASTSYERSPGRTPAGLPVAHEGSSPSAPTAPPPHHALADLRERTRSDGLTYELTVVEHPTMGLAFGRDRLSRIPIFPPLIARLRIFDRGGVEVTAGDDLPFLTCQVSLLTEEGQSADLVIRPNRTQSDESAAAAAKEEQGSSKRRTTRRVSGRAAASARASGSSSSSSKGKAPAYGTAADEAGSGSSSNTPRADMLMAAVAAAPTRMLAGDRPAHAEIYFDLDNQRRLFFIFSDICIRLAGRFRLQLSLTRLPGADPNMPLPSFSLATVVTDLIHVVEREEFRLPAPTPLMRVLKSQGVKFPTTEVGSDAGPVESRPD